MTPELAERVVRGLKAAGIDFVAVGDVAPGERRIQRLDELPDLLG